MTHKGYKDQSRINWGWDADKEPNRNPTDEEIQTGALMRIADATELMAKNYQKMQDDLDRYKKWYNEGVKRTNQRDKSIASYRGQITKLKKQIASLKTK